MQRGALCRVHFKHALETALFLGEDSPSSAASDIGSGVTIVITPQVVAIGLDTTDSCAARSASDNVPPRLCACRSMGLGTGHP